MFDLMRVGIPRIVEFQGEDGNLQRWILVYMVGSAVRAGWSVYIACPMDAAMPAPLSLVAAPDNATVVEAPTGGG